MLDGIRRLQSSGGGEGPARTAPALVLDGVDVVASGDPVPFSWQLDTLGGGEVCFALFRFCQVLLPFSFWLFETLQAGDLLFSVVREEVVTMDGGGLFGHDFFDLLVSLTVALKPGVVLVGVLVILAELCDVLHEVVFKIIQGNSCGCGNEDSESE